MNHKREYAVSLDEYEKNMRAILSMYKNVPRIVVTPPPIIEKDRVRHARRAAAQYAIDCISTRRNTRLLRRRWGERWSRRGRCVR